MKAKTKKVLSPADAGRELKELAEAMQNGTLESEGLHLRLGESVFFASDLKVKDGEMTLELTLKAQVQPQWRTSRREPAARPREKERPYDAKRIKKHLGALWSHFRQDISAGHEPAVTLRADLTEALEAFEPFIERPWAEPWRECVHTLRACAEASGRGDLAAARTLMEQVDLMIRRCHQAYK